MEYITGAANLQAIFSVYWSLYCIWFKQEIREAVKKNAEKILRCRTLKWVTFYINVLFLIPAKGLKKRWRHNVIESMIKANKKGFAK
jgi:hypothetical protein